MKHIFFIISLFALQSPVFTQPRDSALQKFVLSTLGKTSNSSNSAIEHIFRLTDEAVHFVRQDYLLKGKKSGKLYGLPEKDYFGRVSAISIAANGKVYTFGTIAKPWNQDENYGNLDKSDLDTLSPALEPLAWRRIMGDSTTTLDELKYDTTKNGLCTFAKPGKWPELEIEPFPTTTETNKRLHLLIYHTEQNVDQEPKIKATAINVDPAWGDKDGTEIKFEWKEKGSVLGGILFVETLSVGKVEVGAVALFEPIAPGKGKIYKLGQPKVAVEPKKNTSPANKKNNEESKSKEKTSGKGKEKEKNNESEKDKSQDKTKENTPDH